MFFLRVLETEVSYQTRTNSNNSNILKETFKKFKCLKLIAVDISQDQNLKYAAMGILARGKVQSTDNPLFRNCILRNRSYLLIIS